MPRSRSSTASTSSSSQARIGVEAGEVVTGAGDSTFATGEARQHRRPPPAARGTGPDPARPRGAPAHAGPDRGRRRRPGRGAGPRRAGLGVGRDGRRRPGSGARRRHAARRPRSRARPARRTRSPARRATGAPIWSRSTASRASARAASPTSFSPRSRARPSSRALSPVRREHHVLAARRDGQGRSRHRRRRSARRRDREAARVLPGRGGRRPARARDRRARGRPRRAQPAGDLLGGARMGAGDGADAAADPRLRGHPLGRGAAARADRAHDVLGARRLADDHVPRAPGAARHPLRLGRRPRPRDGDRARAARRRRQRGSDRGAAAEDGAISPATKRALLEKTGRQPAVPRGGHAQRRRVRRGAGGEGDPGHGPGADRRSHRPARRRLEGRAPAGVGHRPHVLGRCDRAPVAEARASTRRSTICCSATSSSASRARRSRTRPRTASSTCSSATSPTRA